MSGPAKQNQNKGPAKVAAARVTTREPQHANPLLNLQRAIGNRALRRMIGSPDSIPKTADEGARGSGGSLPYFEQIQRSFGRHDISDARAYQGSRAAAAARTIGASAYTIGDRIAFTESPDLRTAAHEATHVVQQRAGVQLSGDVGKVGDIYERHADAVADLVVKGRSAESLLNQMAPVGSRALSVQRQVVQRTPIKTDFGEFDTTKYKKVGPAGSEYGVEIKLTFNPDSTKVDAEKIGLTQSVRSQLAGSAVAIEPSRQSRLVPSGVGEGREIDRTTLSAFSNPIYATKVPKKGHKLGDTKMLSHGQWGYSYKDSAGKLKHKLAWLKDTPTLPGRGNNASQTFETAALAAKGTQSGTYLGSVSWGWKVNNTGKFNKLPLTLVSKGDPSKAFIAAAKRWNKWHTMGKIKTTPNPTNVYNNAYSVAFTVAKDTDVQVTSGSFINADILYSPVNITGGPQAGKSGRIKVRDLRDTGGGRATIDLPIP